MLPLRASARFAFRAAGDSERRWGSHATGRVSAGAASAAYEDLDTIRSRITGTVDVSEMPGWLSSLGLEFGPSLRAVESIARGDGELLARMRVGQTDRSPIRQATCYIRRRSTPACT